MEKQIMRNIYNHENDDLSKKSRGKEKISDSKSSWSLITESSEGGTSIDTTHEFYGPSSCIVSHH